MKVQILVIDPQVDFMDSKGSALPVPGANDDMDRLSVFIDRVGGKLDDIHVTMDSHHTLDYRHPGAWRDQDGNQPTPIVHGGAPISEDDINAGIWTPIGAHLKPVVLDGKSIKEFMTDCARHRSEQTGGAVPGLEIWPEHCVIGTQGHNIQAGLMNTLQAWERKNKAYVNYCVKGTNIFTEHYGALMANDVLNSDPTTGLNIVVLEPLQAADKLIIAGQAASHCVPATVNQIVENFSEEEIKKIVLFTDCMSPVGAVTAPDGTIIVDFPGMTNAWYNDMKAIGVTLTTSDAFMA